MERNPRYGISPPAVDVVVLAGTVAAGLWICRAAFAPGLPASWDAPSHLVRLQFLRDELFRQWRLEDLWFASWYNGFPIFLFYPPLFYVLTLGAHAATLGLVPLATTYKVAVVTAYLALPVALYAGVRLLDLGRPVALLAAVLLLGMSSVHGLGIEAIFMIGIITHCSAVVVLPVALGAWHRGVTRGGLWLVAAPLLAAVIVQMAFIVSAYLAVETILYTLLALVVGVTSRAAIVRRTAAMGTLVVLASAWWVLPMALATERLGPQTGFGPTSIADFLRFTLACRFLGSSGTMAAAAVGLVVCLWRRTFVHGLLALTTVVALVLAFGVGGTGLPTVDRVVVGILRNRSFGFVGMWSAVLAAVAIESAVGMASRAAARLARSIGRRPERWARIAAVGVFALIAGWLAVDGARRVEVVRPQVVMESAFDGQPDRQAVLAAFDWLHDHGDRTQLVGFETRIGELGPTGFNDPFSVLVLRTGLRTLGGLNVEGTKSSGNVNALSRLHDRTPIIVHDTLQHFGIGTLVVYVQDTVANLASDPSRFEEVFNAGRVYVFRLRRRLPRERLWQIRPWGTDPFRLKAFTVERRTEVALPVSWDPDLRVSLDGVDVPIRPTADNLVAFVVPKKGASAVSVRWPRHRLVDALTVVGGLVQATLATTLVLAGVSRRRRATRASGGEEIVERETSRRVG